MKYEYAVRWLKRSTDVLTNNKFVEPLIVEIYFTEIGKLRRKGNGLSSWIDDDIEQSQIT